MKGLLVSCAVAGLLGTAVWESGGAPTPIERGRYLAQALGCQDCHTATVRGPDGWPVPDGRRLMAGEPEGGSRWTLAELAPRTGLILTRPMGTGWKGSWGSSFAANLTPDPETGLGRWTEAMFVAALRTGRHEGRSDGRYLLPPMPWANLTHAVQGVPEADLKALWAYLQSLPPIRNRVPPPRLP